MSIEKKSWIARPALNGSPQIARRSFLGHVAAAGMAAGASSFPAIAQDTSGH